MTDRNLSTTPRPRRDGIDIERLALALLEYVEQLPERQRKRLAITGKKLIDAAEKAGTSSAEGAA